MKKILLLERHRLGDAVMSLPFLRGAEEAGWEVHVGCSEAARPLYELTVPPERIVTVHPRSPASFRALHRIGAEAGVSVWADVRDHLWLRLLGIPRRISFPMNRRNYYAHALPWRERSLRIGRGIQAVCRSTGMRLLTEALERRDYEQHHVADWGQTAEALGFGLRLRTPWLELAPASLSEAAERFFRDHAGERIWLLHPGAFKPGKRWPHYARLVAEIFEKRGIPLVVVQTPEAEPIPLGAPSSFAWPAASLGAFFQIVSRCDFVLCNDSAASHVGAALGKRVLAVFGSGSSRWFAPYSPGATVIESSACPVRPCFDRCVQPSYLCLEGVSYGQVAGEIERTLATDDPGR